MYSVFTPTRRSSAAVASVLNPEPIASGPVVVSHVARTSGAIGCATETDERQAAAARAAKWRAGWRVMF